MTNNQKIKEKKTTDNQKYIISVLLGIIVGWLFGLLTVVKCGHSL